MQQKLKISNNQAKLHQALGSKLYASEYSFISELCQNAVDSHRMAGVKEPIVVGIKYDNPEINGKSIGNMVFYVKDIGLSFQDKEDFESKICTILESGKDENKTDSEDCPMGNHGIGSISVSKYSKHWKYTVITPNYKKFECKLEEIEGEGLTYLFSDYKNVDDEKSVMIEVPIKPYNVSHFLTNMKEKLSYFKDINFEFDTEILKLDASLMTINSDFKLFQSDDFQYSTLSKKTNLHITIDQYTYDIRWEKLGISPIQVNIALKFSLVDGLTSDLTRENLVVNDQYANIIKDKILKVADYFVGKYNEFSKVPYTDLSKYLNDRKLAPYVDIYDYNFPILNIASHSSFKVNPISFDGISNHTIDNALKLFVSRTTLYQKSFFISNSGSKHIKNNISEYGKRNILIDSTITPKMNTFIKSTYLNCIFWESKKIPLYTMKRQSTHLVSLLSLCNSKSLREMYKQTGVNLWRVYINAFKLFHKEYEKIFFSERSSSIVIPSTFNIAKRVVTRKEKVDVSSLTGEIGIRYAENSSFYNQVKYTEVVKDVADIAKINVLHVYGDLIKDRYKLDDLYRVCKSFKSIKVCTILQSNVKYMNQINKDYFMNIEDFFKGGHDEFRKLITSYRIRSEVLDNRYINGNIKHIHKYLCKEFSEDFDKLKTYHELNKIYTITSSHMDAIIKLAEECDLYDKSIYDTFIKVKEDMDKFEFVHVISSNLTADTKLAVDMIKEIANYRKVNNPYKNYK